MVTCLGVGEGDKAHSKAIQALLKCSHFWGVTRLTAT